MNITCDIESAEYEGQFKLELNGAVIGCNCTKCKLLREKDEFISNESFDRHIEDIMDNERRRIKNKNINRF